jgi:conjugal transfer pilus assembly protein TraV
MQGRYLIIASLLAICCSGCFLNPYSSDFTCPKTANGKCVSLTDAYEESLRPKATTKGSVKGDQMQTDSSAYKSQLLKKLVGLIQEPTTPLVVPPTVMRGLVLPYLGDENELYSSQYVYFFIDEPSFVFGEYRDRETERGAR